jgi:Tol biopolymer transport system component
MNQVTTLSIFLTLLIACNTSCRNSERSSITVLSDQIPMDTPLVFGPSLISTDDAMEFAITFSPEMDEMYFTRRKPEERNNIFTTKLIDGQWTEPELAYFSTNETWDFEPHINPKGDVLYFGTNRPLNDTTASSGIHEWYINKNENGWTQPMPLEKPFVEDRFVMYVTSSENGNLYFNSEEKGANPDDELSIYYSVSEEGQYSEFKKMGEGINSGTMIAHPFIAPDESYMIFDAKKSSGYGDCDLYISFNKNGVWSKSYNLGPKINTEQCEMTASVSPDGNYLFFHRGGGEDIGNIYWVDFIPIKEHIETIISN